MRATVHGEPGPLHAPAASARSTLDRAACARRLVEFDDADAFVNANTADELQRAPAP